MAVYKKTSNGLELYDAPFYGSDLFPIGYVYTQYPNTPSPVEMGLSGTWTEITSNFDSYFFRAEGSNAAPFGECQDFSTCYGHLSLTVCNANSQYHTHSCGVYVSRWYDTGTKSSGLIQQTRKLCPTTRISSASGAHTHSVTLADNLEETRPENVSIRIWKRTA